MLFSKKTKHSDKWSKNVFVSSDKRNIEKSIIPSDFIPSFNEWIKYIHNQILISKQIKNVN